MELMVLMQLKVQFLKLLSILTESPISIEVWGGLLQVEGLITSPSIKKKLKKSKKCTIMYKKCIKMIEIYKNVHEMFFGILD